MEERERAEVGARPRRLPPLDARVARVRADGAALRDDVLEHVARRVVEAVLRVELQAHLRDLERRDEHRLGDGARRPGQGLRERGALARRPARGYSYVNRGGAAADAAAQGK